MKQFKSLVALALAFMMVFALVGTAMAGTVTPPSFTLTISNTDQNVSHTYKAYQIFTGDLNGGKLTNINWGNGVKTAELVNALLADPSPIKTTLATALSGISDYTTQTAAQKLAGVLGAQTGTSAVTDKAGDLDVIASIIASKLTTNGTALNETNKVYTANLSAGYYIVVDETGAEQLVDGTTKYSDTKSKSMLAMVADVNITAKDTGLKPDKKILKASGENTTTEVENDSSAIGDEVKFQVKINVPDTRKYLDHFVFHMIDQLPNGLTYKANSLAIKINGSDYLATQTVGTNTCGYTTTVKTGTSDYAAPANNDYVNSTGGQSIKVVFTNFKAFVDANTGLIGKDIVITYSAIVNKNANFTPTGNENKVKFEYSNNPDHDYNGDDFQNEDPKGTTPESKTKTFLTNLKIKKVDEKGQPLAGAEFKIEGTTYNTTLVTGEHYVEYGAQDTGTKYWKLKDGTYTTTDPQTTGINQSKYEDITKVYKKEAYSKTVVTPADSPKTVTAISAPTTGLIKLEGINAGTYTITETSAPEGYNKIEGNKTIEITFNATNGTFSSSSTDFQYDDTDKCWYIEIQNQSGTELPSTGGIGTTIFYVAGLVLVLGAAAIIIARRKAEQE